MMIAITVGAVFSVHFNLPVFRFINSGHLGITIMLGLTIDLVLDIIIVLTVVVFVVVSSHTFSVMGWLRRMRKAW